MWKPAAGGHGTSPSAGTIDIEGKLSVEGPGVWPGLLAKANPRPALRQMR